MNKILSKITAASLALVMIFALSACAEIENGSKIERIKITLSLYDEDGNTTDCDDYAKLYINFAPETTAHVKELIESGYYNGLCVSSIASGYVRMGDYALAGDDRIAMTLKDANVKTVKGEFADNGLVGNKLTATAGALVLLRGKEYDGGKATIAACINASSFDSDSYCVFGRIVSDDGNDSADSSSIEYKSSLERVRALSERLSNDDGRKLFYCIDDETIVSEDQGVDVKYNWKDTYFTYGEYEDSFNYYKGVHTAAEIASGIAEDDILSEEEAADLTEKMSEKANDFLYIPVLAVVIKSVSMVK